MQAFACINPFFCSTLVNCSVFVAILLIRCSFFETGGLRRRNRKAGSHRIKRKHKGRYARENSAYLPRLYIEEKFVIFGSKHRARAFPGVSPLSLGIAYVALTDCHFDHGLDAVTNNRYRNGVSDSCGKHTVDDNMLSVNLVGLAVNGDAL